jgi:hypothetical protein
MAEKIKKINREGQIEINLILTSDVKRTILAKKDLIGLSLQIYKVGTGIYERKPAITTIQVLTVFQSRII